MSANNAVSLLSSASEELQLVIEKLRVSDYHLADQLSSVLSKCKQCHDLLSSSNTQAANNAIEMKIELKNETEFVALLNEIERETDGSKSSKLQQLYQ